MQVLVRCFLVLTMVISIAVSALSFWTALHGESAAWATLAAALAVIASVFSAQGAIRVVELEEEKLRPYPYPFLDATSRYGLMLLKLSNLGGSPAYNVRLTWDNELIGIKGQPIAFAEAIPGQGISILRPGQSLTKMVNGHIEFFQGDGPLIFRGRVQYEDGHGRRSVHPFVLDGEMYRGTPMYEDESLQTHRDLQAIPDRLKEVTAELKKILAVIKPRDES